MGLCCQKTIDIYRNRIMFPIHNIDGKVVAFTGRVYNKESQAKYLGSKETKIYHTFLTTQNSIVILWINQVKIKHHIQ